MAAASPGAGGPDHDDEDIFRELPAGYQQVMSPSGDAAQVTGPRHDEDQRPNGVNPRASRVPVAEPDYDLALGATGSGDADNTGFGARTANVTAGAARSPTGGGDAEGGAGSAQRRDIQRPGSRMSGSGTEMFRSPVTGGGRERMDGPLFPHATQGGNQPRTFSEGATTRSINGDEGGSTTSTNVIAQQGVAAMKWLSRLGEYVQRRVSQQSRPGEQTVMVQETVWSPSRQGHERSGTEPLFDREQNKRFQEMALAAPQLYGATQRGAGGGSDSSRSFTKEQLELEVRRHVDQAMEQQKQINEENQRLRLEVERLRGRSYYEKNEYG